MKKVKVVSIAFIAMFELWIVISFVNVNMHNLPPTTDIPSWNAFEIWRN